MPAPSGDKARRLTRWGWGSIAINLLLGGLNMLVLWLSGSLAVAAEMVHNAVDLAASVAVLVGLKLSTHRSRRFPYGLYKVENLVAAAVAILIFLAAYEIVRKAILGRSDPVTVTPWVLAGVVASAIIPLVFSTFQLRAGRAANSPSLIADAKEFRVHVLTSGVVLASLLTAHFGDWPERAAALSVAVIIVKTGWDLLSDSMRVLLDASLEPTLLGRIRRSLEAEPSVAAVETLIGRNAGRYRFVEATVESRLRALDRADNLSRQLEHKLHQVVPFLEQATVHVRPVQRDHIRIALPIADDGDVLFEHFGKAPRFMLVDLRRSDGETIATTRSNNPFSGYPKGRGIKVAQWLIEQGVDVAGSPDDIEHKGPGHALREAGVDVVILDTRDHERARQQCFERARY